MAIRDYGTYKGVPIYQDFNVADGEQVYIGNGQGCATFWFKSVAEAREFIDRHREQIQVTDFGSVRGLIPSELCEHCKGHYSYGTPEWNKATRDNCSDYKEQLKNDCPIIIRGVSNNKVTHWDELELQRRLGK